MFKSLKGKLAALSAITLVTFSTTAPSLATPGGIDLSAFTGASSNIQSAIGELGGLLLAIVAAGFAVFYIVGVARRKTGG